MADSPFLEWVYAYPVNKEVKPRELYAQNVALYHHNKELFRERLPENYKHFVETRAGRGRLADGADGTQERSGGGETVRPSAGNNGSVRADTSNGVSRTTPAPTTERQLANLYATERPMQLLRAVDQPGQLR